VEAAQTLAASYASRFPADTARRLETIAGSEVGSFLADLAPEIAVAVIARMLPSTVAAAFNTMDSEELAPILEVLPDSRCVLVLRSLEKDQRAAVVRLLPAATAPKIERLLRSPRGSAGMLAEPAQAVLSPEMSVNEARDVASGTAGPYVYVVDDDHRLVGVIHRKELASGDSRARIGSLMSGQVIRLPSAAPFSAVRNHPAWKDLHELPVVDGSGVLVGVVRHRSVRYSEQTHREAPISPRPGLATFLELGELYWGGLTSVVAAMAGRPTTQAATEVQHDR